MVLPVNLLPIPLYRFLFTLFFFTDISSNPAYISAFAKYFFLSENLYLFCFIFKVIQTWQKEIKLRTKENLSRKNWYYIYKWEILYIWFWQIWPTTGWQKLGLYQNHHHLAKQNVPHFFVSELIIRNFREYPPTV